MITEEILKHARSVVATYTGTDPEAAGRIFDSLEAELRTSIERELADGAAAGSTVPLVDVSVAVAKVLDSHRHITEAHRSLAGQQTAERLAWLTAGGSPAEFPQYWAKRRAEIIAGTVQCDRLKQTAVTW